MSELTQAELLPFDGGPPDRLQRSLGLIKPDDRHVARRALLVMAVEWVPLAVLAAAQGYALRGDPRESFLLDFGAYSRFLIAAPLLVVAESDCLPRLARIVRHFIDAGMVPSGERARFAAAVASTRRLLNAGWAEVVIVAVAYVLAIALQNSWGVSVIMRWQAPAGALSLAGWWYMLVSFPLLFVLLLGWLWRVLLWGRILWLVSRLELRLVAAHPDLVGG